MKTASLSFLACLVVEISGLGVGHAAELVTRSAVAASVSAGGNSFGPVISADGRHVVLVSHARNLVTNEAFGEFLQVFLRDLDGSNTTLISVGTNGRGGIANSIAPAISSNGLFVAFASEAGNLVDGDTNQASDVFVRDISSGATRLVSADLSGRAPNDFFNFFYFIRPLSAHPLISADGRWVFFESNASSLTSDSDTNGAVDVFARDLQSNVTRFITLSLSGGQAANAGSALASITPDGKRAAFMSAATDLVPGVGASLGDVYVRDVASNITFHASSGLSNYSAGYRCLSAVLSDDGSHVAFIVKPVDGPAALFRRDLESQALLLVTTNVLEASWPQISADGRYVTFEDGTNIFRFDAATSSHELVNVTTNGGPLTLGIARHPVASRDGSGVAFISDLRDLVPGGSGPFQIYARDMAAGFTRLITRATNGQASASSHELSLFSVTPDFSRIAFDSAASDLVAADGNRAGDVFVRVIPHDAISLVSPHRPNEPRSSGAVHTWFGFDSVSADGRFIVFSSYDTDLVPDDTNFVSDLFVRDLVTGSVVSPDFSTNFAFAPMISGDGRHVVYLRRVLPLPPSVSLGGGDVYRFNRETGVEEMISAGTRTAAPAISADGNWVAYRNSVFERDLVLRDMARGTERRFTSDLFPQVNTGEPRDAAFTPDGRFLLFMMNSQLYAFDNLEDRTQLVSRVQNMDVGFGRIAISGNSRFVVFEGTGGLYRHDLIAETNHLVSAMGRRPSVSGDGNVVAFLDLNRREVQTLEIDSGTVSTVANLAQLSLHKSPLLSGDGRFVVYADSVARDINGPMTFTSQLFVRDRTLGTTTLISSGLEGAPANASVGHAVLAADGRTVFFQTSASDLVLGDYNDKRDIFVVKLRGEDTDGDGMDDDWEVAYFGNLTRTGASDFEGDGAADRAEFLAGTDPTNAGSVFRVLTVTALGGSGTRLLWTGNPERTYRVEFKDDVAAATWSALSGPISWTGDTWTGDTASLTDTNAAIAHRFYRVVRVP